MGLYISNLKSLSNNFKWYFFLLGDYRNHDRINDFFRDDFKIIAERIASDSSVIQLFDNGNVEEQLIYALNQSDNLKIGSILENEDKNPGLLIINCHPNFLNKDSTIIYIPFQSLDKAYKSNNELLVDIVDFSNEKNKKLYRKTSRVTKVFKTIPEHVSISLNLGILAINFN